MKLHDTQAFLSKLTIRRVWNVGKLLCSYHYSRIVGKSKPAGMPMTISLEPTTACNLKCPECPSGLRQFSRPTGNAEMELFQQIIEELQKDLIWIIFYFQGEPFIHTGFLDMVSHASKKKLYTITSTNGHFLNDENARRCVESGLDRLIISVDGVTQETYESYRKEGNLENVLAGARNVVKWKKKLGKKSPYLIFQFLVVRQNEHEIPGIYKLAEEIGIDEVKLKTAQLYDYKNGNPLIPQNNKYSRYRKTQSGEWVIKNKLANHCWKLWHSCVITWDGLVVPCCFDKDALHQFGDLKLTSFQEVWKNEKYQAFRKAILKGRKSIDICTNCTEGTRVWTDMS